MKKPFGLALTLGILGLLGAGILTAFVGKRSNSVQPLLLCTWSNYISDEILQAFTRETGIPVEMSYIASNEELFAKMRAGSSEFDVITPTDYMVHQMVKADMLTPLDRAKLPHFRHLDPYFTKLEYDPNLAHSIPFVQGTTGIAVNTEFVSLPDGEQVGWDLLFNSPHPRNTSFLDDLREVFAAALLKSGYPLNDRKPDHLKVAAEAIRKAKSNVALFTSEPLPLLEKKEIWIAHTYSTHGVLAALANPKVRFLIPKEGGTLWTDNFVIPKSSHQAEAAHLLINFFLDPKIAAQSIAYNRMATPNATARKALPKTELRPDVYPTVEVKRRLTFMADLGEALPIVSRLWTEVKI